MSQRNGSGSRRPSADLKALVRWLTGSYAGTFTHDVDVTWIQDFDPDNYESSTSYTVEWRKQPKPRAGWLLFDCCVLEVSADLDFLKARMAVVSSRESDGHETPSTTRNGTDPNFLRDILNTIRSSLNVPGVLQGPGPQGQQRCNISSPSTTDESQNVMKVGTALVVSHTAYIAAKSASSPSRMVTTLVRAAFSKTKLRRSTYAGQKRNGISKPSLKVYRKMQDIHDFTKQRFPYLSQAAFGAAVNSCTGKNVDKEKVIELRDESDSDDGRYF